MTQMTTFESAHRSAHVSFVDAIFGRVTRLAREYRARTQLKHLLAADPAILEDIGVTRDEIRAALNLPFHRNAAQALMQQSSYRRREERGY